MQYPGTMTNAIIFATQHTGYKPARAVTICYKHIIPSGLGFCNANLTPPHLISYHHHLLRSLRLIMLQYLNRFFVTRIMKISTIVLQNKREGSPSNALPSSHCNINEHNCQLSIINCQLFKAQYSQSS